MILKFFNVLPLSLLKELQSIVFSEEFPWFQSNIDYFNTKNNFLNQWSHTTKSLFPNNFKTSLGCKYDESIELICKIALINSNIHFNDIYRIRIGLHTTSPKNFVGGAHVDTDTPHKVALFYLNDSDGDTIIYNETYDFNSFVHPSEYAKNNLNLNFTIKDIVTPKENCLITFDGMYYHSSSLPLNTHKRYVVNIVYK